jgi:hypothetical protein
MTNLRVRLFTFASLTLATLGIATPADAARFEFERRSGTLVWDGDSDAVTSNRLTQYPDPEDRTVSSFGFEDPLDVLFELDLTIRSFDPADFPSGLQPFAINFLTLYLTVDAGDPLCQPSGTWAGCMTLSQVVPAEVDDLDSFDGDGDVDFFEPIVAFAGQLGPTGPAADGDLFTLMPQFFDDYSAAVARFGAPNLVIGLSASFQSNCLGDLAIDPCVEVAHIVTTQTPEPASIALLAIGLVSAGIWRRRV